MTKYKEYFRRMFEENKEAFAKFADIHTKYKLDKETHQEEFNREGEKILAIIREWEGKLCHQSEIAGYASYTGGLAEKFQGEVRRMFPLIDHVGIIVKPFILKKISLEA